MALYLGSDKIKINLDNTIYYLNLFSMPPITNGVRLLSEDNYTLKDLNGLYITSKEDR